MLILWGALTSSREETLWIFNNGDGRGMQVSSFTDQYGCGRLRSVFVDGNRANWCEEGPFGGDQEASDSRSRDWLLD